LIAILTSGKIVTNLEENATVLDCRIKGDVQPTLVFFEVVLSILGHRKEDGFSGLVWRSITARLPIAG